MWWHARRNQIFFRRNGRVHLNQQGHQISRLLAAEVCASAVVMLDTPCSEVVRRVLATHSIRQFPLHFPFRASPCAITFQLDSTFSGDMLPVNWTRLLRIVTSRLHSDSLCIETGYGCIDTYGNCECSGTEVRICVWLGGETPFFFVCVLFFIVLAEITFLFRSVRRSVPHEDQPEWELKFHPSQRTRLLAAHVTLTRTECALRPSDGRAFERSLSNHERVTFADASLEFILAGWMIP
jgi:hypothetical protein